jgi:hypothetical protein
MVYRLKIVEIGPRFDSKTQESVVQRSKLLLVGLIAGSS